MGANDSPFGERPSADSEARPSFRAHAAEFQKQSRAAESEFGKDGLTATGELPRREPKLTEIQQIQNQFGPAFAAPSAPPKTKLSGLSARAVAFTAADLPRDGKLKLYLLDIVEETHSPYTLFIIGRTRTSNGFASVKVRVTGSHREFYVIPRKDKTAEQVRVEFEALLAARKARTEFQLSIEERRYCFEYAVDLRGDAREVLVVRYPFAAPFLSNIPPTGETYNGVIGQQYSALELFQLRQRMVGPGWYTLTDVSLVHGEFTAVDRMGVLVALDAQEEVPPLTVAGVQLRLDERGKEIAELILNVWPEYIVETGEHGSLERVRYCREQTTEEGTVFVFENEYSLLNDFCILFSRLDPDILLGHDLLAGTLDVLLARLDSRFSEAHTLLARAPTRRTRTPNVAVQVRALFAGRLVADIYGFARETERLEDYSLAALDARCGGPNGGAEDAAAVARVAAALQVLPLTLQLSRVAGCLWSVSLRQARSERNEMLLLHTFWQRGYIVPERARRAIRGEVDGEGEAGEERRGFAGGKVLEPLAGLYNTYVVLLDFNSLYPSIIRHFRICFTTVRREFRNFREQLIEECPTGAPVESGGVDLGLPDEDDEIKDPLAAIESETRSPLLPEVLTFLVNKRKEVRGLLKGARNASETAQLDVRQKAYKLIANSIYGCLGFPLSRFYAPKLAALVTTFGRRLLQQTKRFIEEKGYRVLYGDTDSIMIDTTKMEVLEAIRCGYQIKKDINGQYRPQSGEKQILEVELDGLFKKLLLLKKKKYAGLAVRNFNDLALGQARVELLHLDAKGLDLVRRDWSGLTKTASLRVLDILFESGDISEVLTYVQQLTESLDRVNAQLQKRYVGLPSTADESAEFTLKDFVIRKQLNKRLSEYKEASTIAHVRVARWLHEQGQSEEQLLNHFIPYVIVAGEGNVVERAMHPDLFAARCGSETPPALDILWYKNAQLHAPIERFVEAVDPGSVDALRAAFGLEVGRGGAAAELPTGRDNERRAQSALGAFYAEGRDVDQELLLLPCSRCGQRCPGFALQCTRQQTAFSAIEAANRFSAMFARVIAELTRESFGCARCKVAFEQIYADRCYKCGGELTEKTQTKQKYAILFYLTELARASFGQSAEFRSVFRSLEDALNRTYESNILESFKIYDLQFPPKNCHLFECF